MSHIAVAIPCYNEEATIAQVVKDIKRVLPEADIYVFNNNSSDKSARLAQDAGAVIYHVYQRGKGKVMRAIFDTIQADVVLIMDGDGTYTVEEAPALLEPILRGEVDMVVGNRLRAADKRSLIELHQFGNRLIVKTINFIFGTGYEDILSGYRAISRRCLETVPLLTPGFETETELTLQVLEEGLSVKEIPISYHPRPDGSPSKLRPFHDGWRILMTIAILLRDHHPLRVYGLLGIFFLLVAGTATILKFMAPRGMEALPSSFLAGIIFLSAPIGVITFGIGLVLSAVNTRLREMKQIICRNRTAYDRPRK